MKAHAPIAEMAARNPPVTRTMGIVPDPEDCWSGELLLGVRFASELLSRLSG